MTRLERKGGLIISIAAQEKAQLWMNILFDYKSWCKNEVLTTNNNNLNMDCQRNVHFLNYYLEILIQLFGPKGFSDMLRRP